MRRLLLNARLYGIPRIDQTKELTIINWLGYELILRRRFDD